jgi:hypothetical protein
MTIYIVLCNDDVTAAFELRESAEHHAANFEKLGYFPRILERRLKTERTPQ